MTPLCYGDNLAHRAAQDAERCRQHDCYLEAEFEGLFCPECRREADEAADEAIATDTFNPEPK